MTDCYIYDHTRTPRGRGRADGALHEVPPIELAAGVLRAVRDRNGRDTALVDDVVFGCVQSLGGDHVVEFALNNHGGDAGGDGAAAPAADVTARDGNSSVDLAALERLP